MSRWLLCLCGLYACHTENVPRSEPTKPDRPAQTVVLPESEAEDASITPSEPPAPVDAGEEGGTPAWVRAPFEHLPVPPDGRNLDVKILVVGGKTFPVKLVVPELGRSLEIFDDLVSRPQCRSQRDDAKNAVKVECSSMDGAFALRAHQDGRDLVLDIHGWGDAPPSFRGPHRITLPEGRRARFVLELP